MDMHGSQGLKHKMVAGMASCERPVPTSGSKYGPNCSQTHNKMWLEQLHSAGC